MRKGWMGWVVATVAIFVAVVGPADAARMITGKQIRNSSITGADLKNSTVTGADIKSRSITSGDLASSARGDTGSTGEQGPRGDMGSVGRDGLTGSKGDKGDDGQDSLQLRAAVGADGVVVNGNAIDSRRDATGKYTVAFERDITGCVRVVTLGPAFSGTPIPGEGATALLGTRTVDVRTYTSGGAPVDRDFHLALACSIF